ncbi:MULTISPECIES: cytochrome-c peroxidase [Niastella]|uniref:cytochrome-c peroxidase n=1 Tax=Niastella TaxID=354354 RepID=UPI001ADB8430|nr:cytochrome c peroxidase [Niastella soli]
MTVRWTIRLCLLLFLGCLLVNACNKKSGEGNSGPHPLTLPQPAGFPAPQYSFTGNPLTQEGVELGRKLFYDGKLSKDGNFPCASCHQQFAAFATFDHPLSHGFDNQFTLRNSPGLFNMAWNKEMHWDGGINNIEVQPLAPLTAPNEMAENINAVISKLQQDEEYKKMFTAAFGSDTINTQRMLFAITQFVTSLVSANSKYDKVKQGSANFSQTEQNGYTLFQSKCISCHPEPLFTDHSFRNVGLPLDPFIKDYGRMRITNNRTDSLKFKVPSLRNVALTFPYEHDGRFSSITSVLDHYSSGVQNGPTLDPLLKNKIPLTNAEKFYLLEFLKTLTDSSFINDTRFSQP